MDFLEIYKRVDNICKDKFSVKEKGITTYIQTMEECTVSNFKTNDWRYDFTKLKECRHKRNKIAHESGYTLENTISIEDEIYIEKFYNRLLERTDPLTLYFKKENEYKLSKNNNSNNIKKYNKSKVKIRYILYIIMIIGLIGAIIYFKLMR